MKRSDFIQKIKQLYGDVKLISAPEYINEDETILKDNTYAVFQKQLNDQLKLSFQISTRNLEAPYGLSLYIADNAFVKENFDFVQNPAKYMNVYVEDKQPIINFAQETILKAIRGY